MVRKGPVCLQTNEPRKECEEFFSVDLLKRSLISENISLRTSQPFPSVKDSDFKCSYYDK